ncbi:MAG TPA: hypothetical protein PLP33_27085 [Leptospiraceae bacterium]|nr:hypothetical protein [Leptospiraceae bacterium]
MTKERKEELDKIALDFIATSICLHLSWNILRKLKYDGSEEDIYLNKRKAEIIEQIFHISGYGDKNDSN